MILSNNPKPPAIYLHIGRNKAGSTTLQDYFAMQSAWLADCGIRYMLFGHLAGSVADLEGVASHHALIESFRADPARSIFCSNEVISGFPEHLAALMATDLAPLNVRVILYVRPYRGWVSSCYAYEVRGGCNARDFDSYLETLAPRISFLPAARIWGRTLGWDRVRVRSTNAFDLVGGDLITDCLAVLGLAPPGPIPNVRHNEAAHWMVVELLRLVANRPGAVPSESGWDFEGTAIAEALHELADAAVATCGLGGETAAYFSRLQAQSLAAHYNADLESLRAETGIALQQDDAADAAERRFLPEAVRMPREVLQEIAARAARPAFARQHPEAASYIASPQFRSLLACAPVLVHASAPAYIEGLSADKDKMQASAVLPAMTAPSVADAFTLARQGDLLAAIEAGTRAVRDNADTVLLAAMAEWRRDAFAHLPPASGPAHWPPALPDPFPGQSGIPVIPASELTTEILGGAILHHGSLRVNGLLAPETAQMLREGIDRALAAQTEFYAGRPDTDPGWYLKLDVPSLDEARQWLEGCSACWAADSPAMLAKTIEALRQSGVLDHIASFMGERPALSVAKSTLRRVAPVSSHDWHQDGSFLGGNVRSVNVWLALSDCGVDAPGLDVVGCRLPYVLQTHSHGAYFDWSVGHGLVDILAEGGAPVQTPHFGPGDALLFDHMMLHRTSVKPGMNRDRYAIESWFFAPTNYPMDQVPLVV